MYKELADSTLYKMKKQEIIERLRCAEHNANAYKATLEQHIKNVDDWESVVRCKDCKHYNSNMCCIKLGLLYAKPTDYCSRGERRENNGN